MRIEKENRHIFPFYVVKRMDVSNKTIWLIRVAGIIAAFLLAGIVCTIIAPGSFGTFYVRLIEGTIGINFTTGTFSVQKIIDLLFAISIYLLLALALTPAFKMKFWNIGAEGQALVGCIMTAVISCYAPSWMPDIVVILLSLTASIVAGIVWAIIPAIFKACFNTNETLFTLMMNYVAIALVSFTIACCAKGGTQTFPSYSKGWLPDIAGLKYLVPVIIVAIITLLMIFYLKRTKHGYEITVVGESVNTARYIGINVKGVIIRTMILSGALCGLCGFLIVAGHDHTLTTTLLGGRGFTAVLIAWLGHFNPLEIVLYSGITGFLSQGTYYAAGSKGIENVDSQYFSAIITGLFILTIVAFEFFVNYSIKKHPKEEKEKPLEPTNEVKEDK